jgi:hypothetical protein
MPLQQCLQTSKLEIYKIKTVQNVYCIILIYSMLENHEYCYNDLVKLIELKYSFFFSYLLSILFLENLLLLYNNIVRNLR